MTEGKGVRNLFLREKVPDPFFLFSVPPPNLFGGANVRRYWLTFKTFADDFGHGTNEDMTGMSFLSLCPLCLCGHSDESDEQ